MKRLPEVVKRRIVEHLACFASHPEVVELIAEEFDIVLTPRHVRAYDPTSHQFAGSPHWTEHHRLVRQRFNSEIGEVAIRHRAFRMAKLQSILDNAMERGNFPLAAKILEQAAKEVGNWYA